MADLPKAITALSSHNTQILSKLRQVLQNRIQSSLSDISLTSSPSPGTLSIVNGVKVLFEITEEYLTVEARRQIFDWEIFEWYLARMTRLTVKDQSKAEIFQQEIGYFFEELKFLEGVVDGYRERRGSAEEVVNKVLGIKWQYQ